MNFLESLFKGGPASLALELVYMTGILPIKRFKAQETLNMFKEFNMINPSDTMPLPTLRAIITDDQYGYLSKEGIYIIPIGCLKD